MRIVRTGCSFLGKNVGVKATGYRNRNRNICAVHGARWPPPIPNITFDITFCDVQVLEWVLLRDLAIEKTSNRQFSPVVARVLNSMRKLDHAVVLSSEMANFHGGSALCSCQKVVAHQLSSPGVVRRDPGRGRGSSLDHNCASRCALRHVGESICPL